ncbi:MAG TPA: FAD-binding oxidoreductase [Candidatus Solibacter sp.]|nr:FAD-binding oxidoreductase [Candidatus Solibacter sp.]
MPERKIQTAQLVHAVQLSEQTRHLEFAVQAVDRFDFVPGQFLSLVAPKEGREITRAYSIASAPYNSTGFDLCLNRVDDGFFSNLLCDIKEGETIHFHGPHGMFVLRNPLRDSIFICTGTGVAPIRGFIQWLFAEPQRSLGHDFWLVYGTRYEEDIFYRDFFQQVAAQYPNFHYVATLSRAPESWRGSQGYVQEHVRAIVEGLPPEGRSRLDAYICGLNNMVKANRQLLAELGFEKKSVIYERYD